MAIGRTAADQTQAANSKPVLAADLLGVVKQGKKLLSGITCRLAAGQFTALVGPNGAGKTTLLRCFAGLEPQAAEQVTLLGRRLSTIPVRERGRLVAWCPEAMPVPFAFKAYEVVLMGAFPRHRGRPGPEDHRLVDSLLARLGLWEQRHQRLDELSSGEKRKLMLARALAQRTPLLLLDEPCANLDLGASLELMALLKELCKEGVTVCACLHDVMLAKRFAAYAALLQAGQLVSSGPVAQVLSSENLSSVFGLQVRFHASPDGPLMGIQPLHARVGGADPLADNTPNL